MIICALFVCGGTGAARASVLGRTAATPTPGTGADVYVTASGTVTGAPGATVPIALQWGNNGPMVTAGGIRVTYTPPFGTSLASLPAGWERSGTSVVRNAGALGVGGLRTAVLSVRIAPTATAGALLVGGVARADPIGVAEVKPANNSAISRVRVTGAPNPSPTKSPSPKPSPTPTKSPTPTRAPSPSTRPTPKPTPKPASPKPAPRPTPKATPSKVVIQTRPSPVQPPAAVTTRPTVAATSSVPSPEPTSAAAGDAASSSGGTDPTATTQEPTVSQGSTGADLVAGPPTADPPTSRGKVQVLPLIGSLACFAAAGAGAVMLGRRRGGGGPGFGTRGTSRPF